MFFYDWNIGDWRRSTRTLTPLEKGWYREMIDELRDQEKPLPLDENALFELMGATKAQDQAAIRNVLKKKWTEYEGGWIQKRSWADILNYKEMRHRKAAAGREGGRSKHRRLLEQKLAGAKQVPDSALADPSSLVNREPVTDNQEPNTTSLPLPADGVAGGDANTGTGFSLPDGIEFPDWFPDSAVKAIAWVKGLALPANPPDEYVVELWYQAVGRGFKDGAGVQIQRFAHWVTSRWSKEGSSWLEKRTAVAEKKERAVFSPRPRAIDIEPSWDWPAELREFEGMDVSLLGIGWRQVPGDVRERLLERHEKKKEAP